MAVHFTVSSGADIRNGIIADGHISSSAAIAWSKVSKSGSNLTDLATRTLSGISDVTISAAELNAYDPTGRSSGTVPTSDGSNGITWSTPSISESDPLSLHLTGGTMAGAINAQNITPVSDDTYSGGSDGSRFANWFSRAMTTENLVVHGDATWSGTTNTAGIYAGPDNPDGSIDANAGSLCMGYAEGRGNAYVNVSSTSGTAWDILAKCVNGYGTLDFPSTPAQSSSDLTISVSIHAQVGDPVVVGGPDTIPTGCFFTGFVSDTGQVTVRFVNPTSSAVDPGSGDFKVKVFTSY